MLEDLLKLARTVPICNYVWQPSAATPVCAYSDQIPQDSWTRTEDVWQLLRQEFSECAKVESE